MISTWGSSNGLNAGLSFFLPLSDAGAGAVTLTPASTAGSPTPTFTRATVAWAKLSTGLWAQVASGTARSSYLGADTTVGAYGGYLAEAAATQLVTPTASIRDMTDASWAAVTMTKAKNATGIDGVTNSASSLTATGANSTALQTLTAAASSRTYSAFVRRKTGTGTVFIQQGATQVDITALINATTYTRVSVTDSVLNSAFGFQINTSGDAIEVDFNQFEAGAFATSPMESAGGARLADLLTFTSSGNISGTQGTVYAEAVDGFLAGSTLAYVLGFVNGAQGVAFSTAGNARIFDGTSGLNTANTTTAAAVAKVAYSWSGSTMSVVMNGGTVASAAFDGDMNIAATFAVGTDITGAQNSLFGPIRNLRIYNVALSAAQLQAMTT